MNSLRLAIAGSTIAPGVDPDDLLLVNFLQALGIACTAEIWNGHTVDWSQYNAVLPRSTWDYFQNYSQFMNWLASLDELGIPTINPNSLLRWNSDKRYLIELEQLGVNIIPTQVVKADSLQDVLAPMSGHEVVIKPTVSGTAWNTVRGFAGDRALSNAIAALPTSLDYLVQPFIPEIVNDGEWSLLFFGGVYSHAVRKRPAANDYRVQGEFGGTVAAAHPGPDILGAAERALQAVKSLGHRDICYARIDGVWSKGRFLIMEVEMIEPRLYLADNATAAQRLAEEVFNRLAVAASVKQKQAVSA